MKQRTVPPAAVFSALVILLCAAPAAHAALFLGSSASDVILTTGGSELVSLTEGDLDDGFWNLGNAPDGFTFFGQSPGAVYAGTNGIVTFGSGSAEASPVFLPSVNVPSIAALWADYNASADPYGDIHYYSGQGILKVDYLTNRVIGAYGKATFEIVLFGFGNNYAQTPGTILFSYGNVDFQLPTQPVGLGLNAGDGVRKSVPGGIPQDGVIDAELANLLLNDRDSVRFVPDGTGGYFVAPIEIVPEWGTGWLFPLGFYGLTLLRTKTKRRSSESDIGCVPNR